MKILLAEKENICNPSSSDNITKEVIFVNFVELQLFYANFEMKSIQLWSCIHPLKNVVLYIRRGPELCCLFMSTILFIFNLPCCTVVVLSLPSYHFNQLSFIKIKISRRNKQLQKEDQQEQCATKPAKPFKQRKIFKITNDIFASVCV